MPQVDWTLGIGAAPVAAPVPAAPTAKKASKQASKAPKPTTNAAKASKPASKTVFLSQRTTLRISEMRKNLIIWAY